MNTKFKEWNLKISSHVVLLLEIIFLKFICNIITINKIIYKCKETWSIWNKIVK